MKKILNLSLICLSVLVFTSCKKEVVGPQGAPGVNGVDGNANVIGTNEVTFTVNNWSASGNDWTGEITVDGITQDIVDKGVVQVFIKYGTEWWALPDQNGVNTTAFGFGLGHVSLYNYNTDGTSTTNPGNKTFRVVIISSKSLMDNPNVDLTNYKEVEKAFDLK